MLEGSGRTSESQTRQRQQGHEPFRMAWRSCKATHFTNGPSQQQTAGPDLAFQCRRPCSWVTQAPLIFLRFRHTLGHPPVQSVESNHTARAGRQTMATAGIEHPTTWCSRKVSGLTPTAVFALTPPKSPIVSRPVNTGITLCSTDHATQHTQFAHSLAPLSLDLARPITDSLTQSLTASMRSRSSGRFGLWSRVRGYAKPPALQSTARESPSVHKWCVLHRSYQRPTSRRRQHPFA
jgi:hypothetical protein